jgi:hypothetical protein
MKARTRINITVSDGHCKAYEKKASSSSVPEWTFTIFQISGF